LTAVKIIAGLLALLLIAMGGLFFYSPALLVDTVDRLTGGNQGKSWQVSTHDFGSNPLQKLDIWSETGAATKPLKPVLVFFYGGGWANGTRTEYGFVARAFGAKGFVVVLPDYRKVPEVRFPGFVEDSAAAVQWVQQNIAQYGGDPDRITVAGHSAGAYNALMLALDKKWLGEKPVRAAVSLAGPADFYPFTTKRSKDAMGQAPDPAATQPISFVRADAAPILLMHGSADDVVRIRNAISLEAKQKAAGGAVTLRTFDGASHNDLILAAAWRFRSHLPVLDEAAEFLLANSQPRAVVESAGKAK
jgi:acetyl esterase/lipase